jgi:hypothetical protein
MSSASRLPGVTIVRNRDVTMADAELTGVTMVCLFVAVRRVGVFGAGRASRVV